HSIGGEKLPLRQPIPAGGRAYPRQPAGSTATMPLPHEGGAMFGRERRVLLKDYLDQGLSKSAIAERLGISRRTVYRWITTGQLERDLDADVHYHPRPPVPTKLDPYKPLIQARLAEFPELT